MPDGVRKQMAVNAELLEMLVCPKTKGELELIELPADTRGRLVEKYREHFVDEEPEVTHGLLCRQSELVYPIVSDIPIMLIDEALPAAALEGSASGSSEPAPEAPQSSSESSSSESSSTSRSNPA